jgi:cytochrome P450
MREVAQIPYDEMSPELRCLIAYEPNHALDLVDPQPILRKIAEETPVVRWEFGLGLFRMDDILAAGRNPVLVSADPNTGEAMGMGSAEPLIPLHLDGDVHRHYRRLLDPLFAPRRMALLEPDIRALADDLIDQFIDEGEVDLHPAFCIPLPSTVFLTLFGMPLSDMPALIDFKDRILKTEAESLDQKEQEARKVGLEMRVLLRQRLEERRASGDRPGDLLDSFMHFEVDGHSLDDDEIVNIMHMFTIAGLDTVTSSLSCILAWFATHPEQRDRVIAEPDLLAPAIEEILRFQSPVVSSGPRWATDDTEINGIPVRKGDLIYLCWASGNLDPATFENALSVEPNRTENRHIAFASGIHRCLGSHLARNELRAAIDQLHRRIPDYRLVSDAPLEFEFAGVRQAKAVPVTFARGGVRPS